MGKKKRTKQLGTDQPFLRLMGIGGPAVLKLLGIAAEEAEKYTFRSVVLKEKRMEPDTEAIPLLEGCGQRVYIEFQGYADKFIRYRLASRVMLACTQDKFEERVVAGIIYTDKAYKTAALSVKAFREEVGTELDKSFQEIVLTDYTEAELVAIDPRLIVLAPFTVSLTMDKAELLSRSRDWKREINKVYSRQSVKDALNVTGLFIINRFRNITREEVISMLDFDLRDTVAGQQILEEGILIQARDMVLEALIERFVNVPSEIQELVNSVGNRKALKELHRYAIRSPKMEDFRNILSKVSPASDTDNTAEVSG
ncbi:DUF2887 domain-containing protein [Desulfobacterales bacterium HSG16]|nr:DUF2887 domain-containing protein [Desulfobacterales bacterium HSG16]